MRELSALPALAASHPHTPVQLIALMPLTEWEGRLPVLPTNVRVIEATSSTRAVLTAEGDRLLALPFSVARHADGIRCDQHYGILGEATFDRWSRTC